MDNPGETVTREQLQEKIWPSDTFVDFDHGINNAIKRLREALGDTAETPHYIETVPRRGYRFIGNIRSGDKRFHSIAVLPLQNLSRDPEQEYFVDGLTEALINSLAKISALRVISRTTAMFYKNVHKTLPEIARELGVEILVEGSILRFGERVRIAVQLIEAASDSHLWAESYERDLRDVLQLQSEISRAVASEIQAKLTPGEQEQLSRARLVSPQVYEIYLRGRYHWNRRSADGFKKGTEYFLQAIQMDPNYAAAYAGLADCAGSAGFWGFTSPEHGCGRAKAAAQKSLEIEETAEAHTSLGWALIHYDFDFVLAEKHFKRAIELNPGYAHAHQWYAHCLAYTNRLDEGLERVKVALDIDPLSLNVNTTHVGVLWLQRKYDLAIEYCHKALELAPNFALLRWLLANLFQASALHEKAINERQWAVESFGGAPFFLAELGDSYAAAGKKDDAMRVVDQLQELAGRSYVMAYWLALIHAALNEADRAFQWIERSYQERSPTLSFLKVDPRLDNLRSDPRFGHYLRQLNLPV